MDKHNPVPLLGLAFRAGQLEIGEEPVEKLCQRQDCRLVMTASDTAPGSVRQAERAAETGHCLFIPLPWDKAALGAALGRGAVATLGLRDIGFAAALVEKLAQRQPELYAATAAALRVKQRRRQERRAPSSRNPPDTPHTGHAKTPRKR